MHKRVRSAPQIHRPTIPHPLCALLLLRRLRCQTCFHEERPSEGAGTRVECGGWGTNNAHKSDKQKKKSNPFQTSGYTHTNTRTQGRACTPLSQSNLRQEGGDWQSPHVTHRRTAFEWEGCPSPTHTPASEPAGRAHMKPPVALPVPPYSHKVPTWYPCTPSTCQGGEGGTCRGRRGNRQGSHRAGAFPCLRNQSKEKQGKRK